MPNTRATKITIIEPNPDIAADYKKYLEKRGYELHFTQMLGGVASDSALVIAETPISTHLFVSEYYRRYSIPLIIASKRKDLLHGTLHTPAMAISKPFILGELLEMIQVILDPKGWQSVMSDGGVHQ